MRTPKRPVRHKPVLTVQQATYAVDLGRLDSFPHSELRQNRSDLLRKHRFSQARRSNAKNVVAQLSNFLLHGTELECLRRSSDLSRFFRYLLDVRGDAQVLPFSVRFHLREIILFHETDCVAAEQ